MDEERKSLIQLVYLLGKYFFENSNRIGTPLMFFCESDKIIRRFLQV